MFQSFSQLFLLGVIFILHVLRLCDDAYPISFCMDSSSFKSSCWSLPVHLPAGSCSHRDLRILGVCSFPLLLVFCTSCFTPDSFSSPAHVLVELISTTGGRVSSSKSIAVPGPADFSSLLFSSLVVHHFRWN